MSWENLLEPGNEQLIIASALTGSAMYALHKNDWGAKLETTHELEEYIEEASLYRPLQTLKSRKYKEELNKRKTDYSVDNS